MLDLDYIDNAAIDAGSWLDVEMAPELAAQGQVRIKLKSIDSSAYVKALAQYSRTLAKLKLDRANETPEGRDADAELYAAVTVEWEGFIKSGMDWPCTRENAKQLYLSQPWITRQVRTFVATDENFISARQQPTPPASS
jgi:hypothetical protein